MYYAVRTESDHVPPPGPMITVLASCAQRAALVATLGADPGVIFIGDPSPTQPLRTGATVRGAWAALAIAKRAGAGDVADALSTAIAMRRPADLDAEGIARLAELGIPATWWGSPCP